STGFAVLPQWSWSSQRSPLPRRPRLLGAARSRRRIRPSRGRARPTSPRRPRFRSNALPPTRATSCATTSPSRSTSRRTSGPSTPGPPTPNPTRPTGGIAVGPGIVADPLRTEGEPMIHVDKDGNLWESGPWGTSTSQSFVHRSTDRGDSFHIVSPIEARPDPPPGGGDTDIVTDDQGFAYFVDLEGLVNLGVAVSNDGGNTWKKNPLAVDPAQDRQWFAVDNGATSGTADNTIFLTVHQLAGGIQVYSSPGSTGSSDLTGGLVFSTASDKLFVAPGSTCGQTKFDPVLRNLYLPCVGGD